LPGERLLPVKARPERFESWLPIRGRRALGRGRPATKASAIPILSFAKISAQMAGYDAAGAAAHGDPRP
jgi:hypothetical protein